MKHLEKITKRLLIAAILLITSNITPIFAQNGHPEVHVTSDTIRPPFDPMDSVEVSLLTCSPHEEIYSLYGHSALRWHDGDIDLVFNWGMFSFNKPYFVLRFVFGITDYELGAYPYDSFWPYYQKWGSSITEQVLNLTNNEKRRLQLALAENMKPENKVYRYNFFYNNCSTKPRDMIEGCINGQVVYQEREDYAPSFREMVRECNRYHWWSQFGNDMLLGVKADMKTSREEQEFLPHNLMYDVSRARIYDNGTYRPLVKEERLLVPPGVHKMGSGLGIGPREVFILLLLLSFLIALYEWRKKKVARWWDVLLMTVQGLVGLVLTVMIFSQHPTTSLNLNLLLFNPLPLLFIPAIIKGRRNTWRKWQLAMIILFLAGSLWQSYAEGMWIVALCLLLRLKK